MNDETNRGAAPQAAASRRTRRRRRGRALADDLQDWTRLLAAIDDNAQELATLAPQRAALVALLAQSLGLAERQKALTAGAQVTTAELKAGVLEGRKLASRLRSGVKMHFGFSDERLVQFGTRPLRRHPRPRAEPVSAPAPNP